MVEDVPKEAWPAWDLPHHAPPALEVETSLSQQVKYRSKVKQQMLLALMEKADMTDRQVCEWLDPRWEDPLPYGKPFVEAYEGKERPRLQTLISKVRADLRRSRRRSP